ncbi:MAG: lepB 1 [Mucilaginibacter sp.]|nr:lepB 1 [Mucilaginibacter sp.]
MNWKSPFKKNSDKPKDKKTKLREWADAVVFALIAATIIRGLLFSAYAIPSGSMEGTELTGDYLFVSKCSYGARMPITLLSIPFTEPKMFGINTYWDAIQLSYLRLPGFTSIKKYDVVVFNKPADADIGVPVDQRTTLIKRCQASPGDMLTIVNGQVYINGKASRNAPNAQTSYAVVTDGTDINPQALVDLHMEVRQLPGLNTTEVIMPSKNIATLRSFSNVKSVTPYIQPAGVLDTAMFPHDPHFKWNIDNFGPIQMPKKGWTVRLNDSTLTLYRRAIEVYEHNKVETTARGIMINGKKADTYTFKMDYYWMMGDNRHDSLDCRFWGYVPEDHIIGKAVLNFFSTDSTKDILHKIRWDRILKPIN